VSVLLDLDPAELDTTSANFWDVADKQLLEDDQQVWHGV
jgi:hypothetical protein